MIKVRTDGGFKMMESPGYGKIGVKVCCDGYLFGAKIAYGKDYRLEYVWSKALGNRHKIEAAIANKFGSAVWDEVVMREKELAKDGAK